MTKLISAGEHERTHPTSYEPYLRAKWGLKNYWYPALFSKEIAESAVMAVKIAGVPIVLRRSHGQVYALKDECIHRGVKLSARPTCLTDDTITCWYHGFTYELATGKLATIVAAPDDRLIDRARVRTYPVEEANGIVFVFVGDEDYAPLPPLAHDLPPRLPDDYEHRIGYLLDPHTVLLGIHRTGRANWRLAVENGADLGHVFIHRDNPLTLALDYAFPIGARPKDDKAVQFILNENGPKGVMNMYGSEHLEVVTENKRLGVKSGGTKPAIGLRASMYLPGVLMVENHPVHGMAQYEWYVPIDDTHHEYWEVLAMECRTAEERADFEFKYKHLWESLALKEGFNDCDLFAREQMQEFYADDRGWSREKLMSLDAYIIAWRRLAALHSRGIQDPP